jgi:DNA-binding MarR family transcriptional regulator
MFKDKHQIAAEAWRLLFDFVILTGPQRSRVLGQLGLTPNDARALGTLHAGEPRTMRSLAEAWACDASNATWMVDRLEQAGLAERRPRAGDRRVKLVSLTPAGIKAKASLQAGIYRPPPELMRLPREALEALRDAAARLPRLGGGPPS